MPFNRALIWILVSTLLISGSALMGWLYYLHMRERRLHDDQYRLVAIVQSTPQAEALKTVYLAEILDLSLDRPVNLYQFSAKEAENILLAHPLIKKAMVKKILPGTIYIDYETRFPAAYLGDYLNTAIDEEGYLFPFHPFFTPKRLPVIYLGLDQQKIAWGSCLKEQMLQLTWDVLREFDQLQLPQFYLKQLDMTQAYAESYGQRQIVLIVEDINQDWRQAIDANSQVYLRLNTEDYAQSLRNFRTLYLASFQQPALYLEGQPAIIDLRIPHLAFIKKG